MGFQLHVIEYIKTFKPDKGGLYFAEDIFKWIFFNQTHSMSIKMAVTFVSEGLIDNKSALG